MKRAMDIALVIIGLPLFLPLLLLAALGTLIMVGRPVLFSQARPGLGGRLFTIYKFRTMSDTRDEEGRLLPDEQRLSRFGAFLRSTSLDELPSLYNVLRGDLSWVGPRPLLPEYLPLYSPEQQRRHLVRPGITGWAQVNGRNAIDWDEKLALDVWYVDHRSLTLDIHIIWMTILKVFRREGISHQGNATMHQFRGPER